MRFVIVTGMSGAGKSTAMKMMEDIGFFCIDNLPIQLVDKLVEFYEKFESNIDKVAIGIDIRVKEGLEHIESTLTSLTEKKVLYDILFLDAENEVLIKRYKETRRNHPLAGRERIESGIVQEREKLEFLKEKATYIIDTSQLLTRELKLELEKIFVQNQDYKNLFVTILSFGFKYGIPNPYYVDGLRAKTGNDKEIQDYVMQFEDAQVFLDKLEDLVKFLIPHYIEEGKNQLVISIGCTGGKHRSVTLANELYKRLQSEKDYGLKIEHRDIAKDALRGK